MNSVEIQKIELQEVSILLGVSDATVRNWVKSNRLNQYESDTFHLEEIIDFKKKLESGVSEKLSSRANKRNSKFSFIPNEYISDISTYQALQAVLDFANNKKINKEELLYSISLLLLEEEGLVEIKKNGKLNMSAISQNIKNVLSNWSVAGKFNFSENYSKLREIKFPRKCDFLGLIYQSLTVEGKKAQRGSYYTPNKLVEDMVKYTISPDDYVLDPCCGTGQFLIEASKKVKKPEHIWGFDTDLQAVNIAKINLILEFSNVDFSPNIYIKNTLLDLQTNDSLNNQYIPLFDSIVTNPPWGSHFTKKEIEQLKNNYPEIKSNEAFSYFVTKSYELLKSEGKLSFVLPEAILNIKTHSDIRYFLLTQTEIKKIIYLERVFKNVFTPVLRIDFIKSKPKKNHKLVSEKERNSIQVTQSDYLQNKEYILSVFNNEQDNKLFKKIYDLKHVSLIDGAEWALGIVTGNNKKYLKDKEARGLEPILTGKEIKRYRTKEASNYISFEPERFQQVAPENKYRVKEKLLYKFISKQLVFAYDDKQTLSLNSANLLIPKLDYPIKTILALFNSTLYQFLYQKKFGTIKTLRKNIEQLPLPELKENQHSKITKMIDQLLRKDLLAEKRKLKHQLLDDYIIDLFGISSHEKQYIMGKVEKSEKLLEMDK